jgi:endonuclease/exonuclease/phosphatase family metal-dependent hydrolase
VSFSFARRMDRALFVGLGLLGLLTVVAVALFTQPAHARKGESTVKVMSRNVFLGADLSPGTQATTIPELVDGAGEILNQVDANKFQVRAKGLATEILRKEPDLVGLQEAALWRDAPCDSPIVPPSATHVRRGGDFLDLLMNQLNEDGRNYRLVVSQPEFDFQVWANTDGDRSTGKPFGCEIEGRLTMRDAILARRGAGVKTKDAEGGHFDTLLQVTPGGADVDVTRGWTAVDTKVGDSPRFRFVNTHLEAFDNQASNHTNQGTDVGNGKVRKAQALELIAPGGPAAGDKPVVLLGDLNSDVKTQLKPGDGAADWQLLEAGFAERSTRDPLSCCLSADVLRVGAGADVSQFDHKVDHIMTNDPGHVRRGRTAVTGRRPHNGFWDSDHAGLFTALKFH